MKIRVFTLNEKGKIEFTPAELERLLNDTYAEGQRNCSCNKSLTWNGPYLQPTYRSNKLTCNNATDIQKNETIATNKTPATSTTLKININPEEAKEVSKYVEEVIKQFLPNAQNANDAFSRLAKELNF